MKQYILTCPACGSSDLKEIEHEEFQCVECDEEIYFHDCNYVEEER